MPRPQPAPRLRPDDGLGPGGAHRPRGRARHQLHRADRRAARGRLAGRPPRPRPQPRRRLRRRRALPRVRDGLRPARSRALGPGAGGRLRDDRRLRLPHDDGVRHVRGRRLGGRARAERGRRRQPLLHGVRDPRRQARLGRLHRGQVLRRAPGADRGGPRLPSRPVRPGGVGERDGAVRGHLPDEDPRRVVRDHGGKRRVLRAGALARRSPRPPPQPGAGDLRRGGRGGPARAGPPASAAPCRPSSDRPRGAASTPTRPSPTGASRPRRSRPSTPRGRSRATSGGKGRPRRRRRTERGGGGEPRAGGPTHSHNGLAPAGPGSARVAKRPAPPCPAPRLRNPRHFFEPFLNRLDFRA